jgi:hypothetical protein
VTPAGGRRGTELADAELATLRTQIVELRRAAGVPDGATHDEALRMINARSAQFDRIGPLVVLWPTRAPSTATLPADYERGYGDAYRQAVLDLRTALGWPQ